MRYYAYDSETVPFAPGDMAPALVCIQYQPLATIDDPATRRLQTRRAGALETARRLLADPEVTLVGHNLAYDAAVLCREGLTAEVFRAYDEGRMLCTWVYERLGEIAGFSFRKGLSLASAMKAHGLAPPEHKNALGLDGDAVARDFARFYDQDDVRLEPHRSYALDDCLVGKLFQRQYRRFRDDVPLSALQEISRAMFALQLMSVWGLRTNADLVAAFKADTEAQLAELREMFTLVEPYASQVVATGRYAGHVRAHGCQRAQELGQFLRADGSCMVDYVLLPYIEQAYDGQPPRTPTGHPQRSSLVLAESGDARLEAFAHYGELVKAESADVPMLEKGWLHPRYGLADTGRTTCSKPNVQNLPGAGLVRQCIQPAEGWCFLERDYSGIELCTFAAVAGREVDDWSMAETINASGDPGFMHAVLGGHLLGVSPEELLRRRKAGDDLAENARTRAKNANFGFIGGLGYRKYVDYVRMLSKGKIILTEAESKALRDAWALAVPAGPAYLKWVGGTERFDGTYEARIPGSGILRRGMWYCAAANARFQGLAAAIMHRAMWLLAKACYLPGGRLFGVRVALFVHDAFILETRADDTLHDVDVVFGEILAEAARQVMPEVVTRSEGHAAFSLAKKVAGQKVGRVLDAKGRLVPWTPRAA
jgi:hypothetical protein